LAKAAVRAADEGAGFDPNLPSEVNLFCIAKAFFSNYLVGGQQATCRS